LIAGKYISGNVASLFHVVIGPLMHGALNSNIDKVETEIFVFLTVLDEVVKVGPDF
jgi:hypothetical protein